MNPYTPLPSGSEQLRAPPSIRRSNFVHMRRTHNSITENFVIDPSIAPHPSLLSNVDENSDGNNESDWEWWVEDVGKMSGSKSDAAGKYKDARENLLLESMHSSVNTEVWVVQPRDAQGSALETQPISITLRSKHGSVAFKLVSP